MLSNELIKLKESLLTELIEIEGQLGNFTVENPIIASDRKTYFHTTDQSDTLDEKAHSVTDFEEDRAIEHNLELRAREIKEAIKRIDDGSYGFCQKCVSPIDTRRLQIVPVAKLCIDCGKKTQFI
ncbi:MAG: TraR/DksA C4-type zinc finger protein [Patescibacteria group bacterium]